MSEPEKRMRRFWQIHLSTLLFMLMLLGTFLTLNVPREWGVGIGGGPRNSTVYSTTVGWPCDVNFSKYEIEDWNSNLITDARVEILNPCWLAWNAGTCFGLILLAYGLSEYLVRRREGRKP